VPFAVVLSCESLAAHGTNEGPFVGMSAEMGTEVICAGEFFWTQSALEGGGVFLDAT